MRNQLVNILFATEEDDSRLQKVKRAPEQGKTPSEGTIALTNFTNLNSMLSKEAANNDTSEDQVSSPSNYNLPLLRDGSPLKCPPVPKQGSLPSLLNFIPFER